MVIGCRNASALASAIPILEFLKYLDFSLFKGFLSVLVLILKLLNSEDLACTITFGFIDMAKAAFTNYFEELVLAVEDIDLLALLTSGIFYDPSTMVFGHSHHLRVFLGLHRTSGPISRLATTTPVVYLVIFDYAVFLLFLLGTLISVGG